MNDLEKACHERLKWFKDRIGKRVYRNKLTCKCEVCQHIEQDGLVIYDQDHAVYLHEVEGEAISDGTALQYFDTMDEVKEYEKQIEVKCSGLI